MKNIKLYILTLNWNGEDKLKRLVPSLIPSLNNINYEWFIKDNNSSDNSVDYLKSLENKNIHITEYKDNLHNFSQGCNYLFDVVAPEDSSLILLLNNDIIFNDFVSIKNMISLFKDDVGVVGAKLLFSNTNKLQHAGVVFHNNHKLPYHFRINEDSDKLSSKNRYFQAVTGACLLTKSEYYKNIKHMDANYHWAFEDIDLCLQINKNLNKKIIYCGDTNIFHEESATLKKNPVKNLFMQHNINYFFSKWTGRYIIDHGMYVNNPNFNLK